MIYDSLVDDGLFATLPGRLAEALGARSALFHWHYGDGSADILSHSGYFTDEQLGVYATDFAPHDPWARVSAREQLNDVPLNLEEIVSPQEYERSFFYNEYIRPMGDDTFRCMGFRSVSRWGTGMLALQRGKAQVSFTEAQLAELGRYSDHLRHVLMIRGRLAGLQRQSAKVEAALDQVSDAVFVTTGDGKICHANAAGEALIEFTGALSCQRGRLMARNTQQQAELKRALVSACRSAEPGSDHLLFHQEAGPPLIVAVTPIAGPNGARRALLLISHRPTPTAILPNLLRQLFGLTQAEAEICCRLAEGGSLTSISEDRQVSLGTVRSQLKSIAAKLDCRRQAEIVRIVKAIPLPASLSEDRQLDGPPMPRSAGDRNDD